MNEQESGAWPDSTIIRVRAPTHSRMTTASRKPSTWTQGLFKVSGQHSFMQHISRMCKWGFNESRGLTTSPHELAPTVIEGAHLYLNKLTFRRQDLRTNSPKINQWGQPRLTFCSHIYWGGSVCVCEFIKCPAMSIFRKGMFCPGLALSLYHIFYSNA